MIVNYRASTKTRAPFCGLSCCGNHFGRCDRSCFRHDSRMNRKILMRRYAKRAERILIQHEIKNQLIEDYFFFVNDVDDTHIEYAEENILNDCFEGYGDYDSRYDKIDSRDIDDALDREHWIREGEMRDEYYSHYEE